MPPPSPPSTAAAATSLAGLLGSAGKWTATSPSAARPPSGRAPAQFSTPTTSEAPYNRTTPAAATPARAPETSVSRVAESAATSEKKRQCNCKHSQCLKLYCECFASGVYCVGCNCQNCLNNPGNEGMRREAIESTLERNPAAFRPKIAASASSHADLADVRSGSAAKHNKGCHCKKSGCLKKYCECFQANIPCGDNCKCVGCKNLDVAARGHKHDAPPFMSTSPLAKRAKLRHPPGAMRARPSRAKSDDEQPFSSTLPKQPSAAQLPPMYARTDSEQPKPNAFRVKLGAILTAELISEICQLLLLAANEATAPTPVPSNGTAAEPALTHMMQLRQLHTPSPRTAMLLCHEENALHASSSAVANVKYGKQEEAAILLEFKNILHCLVHTASRSAEC